jgi:hypothetical protein
VDLDLGAVDGDFVAGVIDGGDDGGRTGSSIEGDLGTFVMARSTRRTQDAQVMPAIG